MESSLTSFDGTERISGHLQRPEHYRDLSALISLGRPMIARGSGLSYSAASMGTGATSVDMTRFDRILGFDGKTGSVRVEAGLRIGALAEFLARKGRYLPALPGYPDITVGGCIAFDVHGKSQYHSGNFGEWVESFELLHPDHGALLCSRAENEEVFELTIGGFGLTGIITEVALRTQPLRGLAVRIEPVRVADLDQAVEVLQGNAEAVDCLYSWHNLNSPRDFGAGVIYLERFVSEATAEAKARRTTSIRQRSPIALWNRATAPFIMRAYGARESRKGISVTGLRRALFPIEGLELYYLAFGRSGFREYQLIVPLDKWSSFVQALRGLLEQFSVPVTLASLKLFKGVGRHLSFAGHGVCLALDTPARPESVELFRGLDELAVGVRAPLNLAKDSRIDAALCRRIFPEYELFARRLLKFDSHRRCQSRLRERIGV